jgi:ubiquinone/menaquinone biosynthesis C-methylase UbiE
MDKNGNTVKQLIGRREEIMGQNKGYVDPDYLRIAAEQVAQLKRKSYAAMHIQPGDRILDVGCGPATDTVPLASLVGSAGQVVGIDADPAMIAQADQHAAQAGVSDCVTHKVGDVLMMPFADGEFRSCRSERLFQHLPDPARALAEIARVTVPDGWVVTLDTDWGSLSVDCVYTDIERRISRILPEHLLRNGYAARQLYRLYREQGFRNITIELLPTYITNYPMGRMITLLDQSEHFALENNLVTTEELDLWHSSLQQAADAGTFFASASMILVSGQK